MAIILVDELIQRAESNMEEEWPFLTVSTGSVWKMDGGQVLNWVREISSIGSFGERGAHLWPSRCNFCPVLPLGIVQWMVKFERWNQMVALEY